MADKSSSDAVNFQSDGAGSTGDGTQVPPQSKVAQEVQGLTQGRRVTLGGDRRSSLGLAEATLGDLFARRASGFGDGPTRAGGGFAEGRRPSGFGDIDSAFGRRDSLDSTTAVLDAAIMDLTRRRLSMAAGGVPSGGVPSLNDQLSSAVNPMAGLAGMNLNLNGMGVGGQLTSSFGNPPGGPTSMMPSTQASVTAINSRQKQLQDQQRELERRQQELEAQRQQLISAMEERRRTMQQMQQKLHLPPGLNGLGGVGGGNQGLLMGLQGSNAGVAQQPQPVRRDSNGQEWVVRKDSHGQEWYSRKPGNSTEAMQLDSLGAMGQVARKNSLDALRRSSLDLLVGSMDPTRASDLVRAGQLAGPPLGMHNMNMNGMHNMNMNLNLKQGHRDSDAGLGGLTASNNSGGARGEDQPKMSTGPFAMMERPLPLAMPADKDWLTPLHCFVRRHCVQIFSATEQDVATPSKGKRKPIQVGQIGIRCPHCHGEESSKERERGSVYYPTSIASIYNATMNLLQRHLHCCTSVPQDIMHRYETLKADDARSGTSKKYWVESALAVGLVDTPNGIRFSGQVSSSLSGSGGFGDQQHSIGGGAMDFFSSNSNSMNEQEASNQNPSGGTAAALKIEEKSQPAGGNSNNEAIAPGKGGNPAVAGRDLSGIRLVTKEDEPYATGFSYQLLLQMQPCVFTEADRLGKRKGLPPGFPGLACRHCFGGYGSGRFFPSSIKTLSDTSKTLNVLHNHMMRCRKCPQDVRDSLDHLRKTHDEERAKMKFGSQKAFFARIWDRLHCGDPSVNAKRKFQPSLVQKAASNATANNQALQASFQQQAAGIDPSILGKAGVFDNLQQQMKYAGELLDPKRRKL